MRTCKGLRCLVAVGGLLALNFASGQTPDEASAVALTAEDLQARVQQLQDSTAYDESTQSAALENYRRALANLSIADNHADAAERFRQSVSSAPAEAERIQASLASRRDADPLEGITIDEDAGSDSISGLLRQEQAAETSARAIATQLRQRLVTEEARPQAARERLGLANEELRAANDRAAQPDVSGIPAIVSDSQRAAWQSSAAALRAEIQMLDQEILSHPVRIVLLQARADEADQLLGQQQARVRALRDTLSDLRRAETERILQELGLESLGTDALHPLIEDVLNENRGLADELDELTTAIETLTGMSGEAERQLDELRQRFDRARSRLEISGLGRALGPYLAQERRELVAASDYRSEMSLREDQITEASIRSITLGERWRDIRNVEDYVDEQLVLVPAEQAAILRQALVRLLETQGGVLQQLVRLYGNYLRLLADNSYSQSQLYEVNSEYRKFLAEHLMWVRSRAAFGWSDVVALPDEVLAVVAPGRWVRVASAYADRLLQSPLLIFATLFLLIYYWQRSNLHTRLRATSAKVNKPSEDSFDSTLVAVALTSLIALPWPLFVGTTGYEIASAQRIDEATRAIGASLLQVTPVFYVLLWFRSLSISGGVAVGHFRWSPDGVAKFRRQFDWLILLLVIPAFTLLLSRTFGESATVQGLDQIMLVILAGVLTFLLYRLLRPTKGIVHTLRRRPGSRPLVPYPRLFTAIATLIPFAVGVMALAGFMYSAGTVLQKLLFSVLLFFGIGVVRELIVRWLLIIKRRLLLREALQRREAAAREASGETVSPDESLEIDENALEDIASLDADTRKFVNVTLVIAMILGIAGIWSSVLPALGIFRDVTLWQYVAVVAGEETLLPVTLVDILIATIVVIVTVVCARHIPALIEILMRQRPTIKPSTRLAYTTLARYTIAVIGIAATLSIVGVNWSKVQWLIAGLTVGIGFGLRDIIASIISGLIILIERPVRVGDVVTVGEVSGTVSRIQIRATTIRTWDHQELLVPNKEFIANQVLNWSLSDDVVRIFLKVGVAYGSDVEQALRLIEEAAAEHPEVTSEPAPLVTFEEFADSALVLGLRCFIQDLSLRLRTSTDLHRAINKKFSDAGIAVASPQHDVHLETSSPLEVRMLQGAPDKP